MSVRKKAIFFIIRSAKTYLAEGIIKTVDNNDISSNITLFGAFLKRLEFPGVIILDIIFTFLQSATHRLKDQMVLSWVLDYHYTFYRVNIILICNYRVMLNQQLTKRHQKKIWQMKSQLQPAKSQLVKRCDMFLK